MTRLLTCLLCIVLPGAALAQNAASEHTPQFGFSITKLPPPTYPPIALAAHVSGGVVLSISLRPDGAVDSAQAVSGPAMLRDSAINSAKQTQFECLSCDGAIATFRLVYIFELGPSIMCEPRDISYPRVTQLENNITIAAQPFGTCDPMATNSRIQVRSAKCAFLWKCGWRKIIDAEPGPIR